MTKERKKLLPPTNLEPVYLYEKYEPLRWSLYRKFKDKMSNNTDREELVSEIDQIFLKLVNEYDPNRGVDFPYYIKKMMDLRVYHHVDKYLKRSNKESLSDDDNEFIVEDESYQDIFQRIIDLNSIDPNIVLGDKHRRLMEGILIERKSLKELADEEGVEVDRLHARLYFLVKKLKKHREEQEDNDE